MTNDALKEKALEAGRSIVVIVNQELAIRGIISTAPFDIDTQSIEFSDAILANLQPLVDADRQEIERLEVIIAGPAMTKDKYSYRPTNQKEGQGDFVVLDSTDLMRPVFFGDEGHARIHCKFLNTKAVFEPGLNYKIERYEKALRFYAERGNYYSGVIGYLEWDEVKPGESSCNLVPDNGETARTALGEE